MGRKGLIALIVIVLLCLLGYLALQQRQQQGTAQLERTPWLAAEQGYLGSLQALEIQPPGQRWMHRTDRPRLRLPRGERRDFHLRMAQQELDQLQRRVARCTKNCHANHRRPIVATRRRRPLRGVGGMLSRGHEREHVTAEHAHDQSGEGMPLGVACVEGQPPV